MGRRFQHVYNNRRWRNLRAYILNRDGWRCTECGRAGRLEVHHLRKVAEAPDRAYDTDNLTTLCFQCHHDASKGERLPPDIAEWSRWLARQKA